LLHAGAYHFQTTNCHQHHNRYTEPDSSKHTQLTSVNTVFSSCPSSIKASPAHPHHPQCTCSPASPAPSAAIVARAYERFGDMPVEGGDTELSRMLEASMRLTFRFTRGKSPRAHVPLHARQISTCSRSASRAANLHVLTLLFTRGFAPASPQRRDTMPAMGGGHPQERAQERVLHPQERALVSAVKIGSRASAQPTCARSGSRSLAYEREPPQRLDTALGPACAPPGRARPRCVSTGDRAGPLTGAAASPSGGTPATRRCRWRSRGWRRHLQPFTKPTDRLRIARSRPRRGKIHQPPLRGDLPANVLGR
jgi:hypothetical protein